MMLAFFTLSETDGPNITRFCFKYMKLLPRQKGELRINLLLVLWIVRLKRVFSFRSHHGVKSDHF